MKITADKLKRGGNQPVYEIHLPEPIRSMSEYHLVRTKRK